MRNVILIFALLLAVAGCATTPDSGRSSEAGDTASQALSKLRVQGRASGSGYDREQFQWNLVDADANGCPTRDDVLRRDMTDVRLDAPCRVRRGVLQDRYSGRAESMPRHRIEIDHVVALYDAWVSGAQQLAAAQLGQLANDPLNLVATSHELNQQKGSGDAATWLPPNKSYRCGYVARQIAVKAKYGLWVKPAEKRAMQRILAGCPEQALPSGADRPPEYPQD